MIFIAIFILFYLLNTYVFMYQRTTLTIARILREKVSHVSITNAQMLLTPKWMGLLGWISTLGLYGSLILIAWQVGILWAIGILVAVHVSHAIIPIPSGYFFDLVKKHLQKERDNQKDKEIKDTYSELWTHVVMIAKTYRAS